MSSSNVCVRISRLDLSAKVRFVYILSVSVSTPKGPSKSSPPTNLVVDGSTQIVDGCLATAKEALLPKSVTLLPRNWDDEPCKY